MLKGAIFDLGETLIHLTVSWEQVRDARMKAIYDALQERSITVDLGHLKHQYMTLHEEESAYSDRTLEEIEITQTFTRLLDRLGVRVNQRPLMMDLVKLSFAHEVDSWVLFPEVHNTLADVRGLGLKMGLLSNARSDWAVREILDRLDLTKHFDAILTSAALGFRKPRPEPFQQILKLLSLEASEAVMIGNSIEADIAGARPLGIKTIHVIFGDDGADEKGTDPNAIVHRMPDIVPAIKQIAAGR